MRGFLTKLLTLRHESAYLKGEQHAVIRSEYSLCNGGGKRHVGTTPLAGGGEKFYAYMEIAVFHELF